MAKTNRLKLAASLIEAEILNVEKMIDTEATTGHYSKAAEHQAYIEGLEKALMYLNTLQGKGSKDVE